MEFVLIKVQLAIITFLDFILNASAIFNPLIVYPLPLIVIGFDIVIPFLKEESLLGL